MSLMLALHKYASEPGPHQIRAAEIYAELRKNVIDNVYQVSLLQALTWQYPLAERVIVCRNGSGQERSGSSTTRRPEKAKGGKPFPHLLCQCTTDSTPPTAIRSRAGRVSSPSVRRFRWLRACLQSY